MAQIPISKFIESRKGSKYVLECAVNRVEGVAIDVYDILLVHHSGEKPVSMGEKLEIYRILEQEVLGFLSKYDCILFYYCDVDEIDKGPNHSRMLNNEYRHQLFSNLFRKAAKKHKSQGRIFPYTMQELIVENQEEDIGPHFMSFIANSANKIHLQLAIEEIENIANAK